MKKAPNSGIIVECTNTNRCVYSKPSLSKCKNQIDTPNAMYNCLLNLLARHKRTVAEISPIVKCTVSQYLVSCHGDTRLLKVLARWTVKNSTSRMWTYSKLLLRLTNHCCNLKLWNFDTRLKMRFLSDKTVRLHINMFLAFTLLCVEKEEIPPNSCWRWRSLMMQKSLHLPMHLKA